MPIVSSVFFEAFSNNLVLVSQRITGFVHKAKELLPIIRLCIESELLISNNLQLVFCIVLLHDGFTQSKKPCFDLCLSK